MCFISCFTTYPDNSIIAMIIFIVWSGLWEYSLKIYCKYMYISSTAHNTSNSKHMPQGEQVTICFLTASRNLKTVMVSNFPNVPAKAHFCGQHAAEFLHIWKWKASSRCHSTVWWANTWPQQQRECMLSWPADKNEFLISFLTLKSTGDMQGWTASRLTEQERPDMTNPPTKSLLTRQYLQLQELA